MTKLALFYKALTPLLVPREMWILNSDMKLAILQLHSKRYSMPAFWKALLRIKSIYIQIGKKTSESHNHLPDNYSLNITTWNITSLVLYFYKQKYWVRKQLKGHRDKHTVFISMSAELITVGAFDTYSEMETHHLIPLSPQEHWLQTTWGRWVLTKSSSLLEKRKSARCAHGLPWHLVEDMVICQNDTGILGGEDEA